MCKQHRPTIFLDRDGTLNEEVHYLHRPEDLHILPTVIEAVRLWNKAGFRVVVVTNQAGVARGYYQEADVERLHQYINSLMAKEGAHIDQFYYCPHHPEHGIGQYKIQCHCRKPDIGMFEQAEKDEAVDKSRSYMIGDKWIDIEAGFRFGVNTALVGTGYGKAMYEAYLEESKRKEQKEENSREADTEPKTDNEGKTDTEEKSDKEIKECAGPEFMQQEIAEQAKAGLGYFGNTLFDVAKWTLERMSANERK